MYFVASWGLFVFCVLTETLVFMFQITRPGRTRSTRDSRAVGLITTRLQIEASLGSLAKGNIKIWRLCRDGNMNDTPSWLHSTSKVRRHSSSPKLVRCSVESHHQQTVSRKKALMTATTVARATHEKNRRNYFHHCWHLHLAFGEPRSEPETRMRKYHQMRSQAITASSWQWWRSLQATLYGVHQPHVIVNGTVFSRGWMISLWECPEPTGDNSNRELLPWRWNLPQPSLHKQTQWGQE